MVLASSSIPSGARNRTVPVEMLAGTSKSNSFVLGVALPGPLGLFDHN